MDLILNDFSMKGQFTSKEEFLDSLYENTLPMFKKMIGDDNHLYKTYDAYNAKIFGEVTINTFIKGNEFNGYPEISALKRYLYCLITNPYWEDEPSTDCESEYECQYVGKFSGDSPNCFSETLERNGLLISFEHMDYRDYQIDILKDNILFQIFNSFNKESLGEVLFRNNKIGFSEYIMTKKYPREIIFASRNNEYFADELYYKGDLSKDDVISIQKDLYKSLEFIDKGVLKSRFSDSISHKGHTYYEFRCSLDHNREFRIYYYLHHGKLIYFNSFIKKTATISQTVKDKTVDLIKEYIRTN